MVSCQQFLRALRQRLPGEFVAQRKRIVTLTCNSNDALAISRGDKTCQADG